MKPPAYFESIRNRSARRWDQLDRDPELAGPWHQLFKQVQSPRHVLSELLQNADDAGATEATVRADGRVFVFEHNGEDFTEEHLASLCRFGYSNKRALHTIGFRGVGFKSTFSLGDCVELYTSTLAISFDRKRFTEPCWLSGDPVGAGRTRIRVAIKDEHRQRDVERNLQEWLESPVSLLFFKNIRRMEIEGRAVHWIRTGSGPIPNSDWMALEDDRDRPLLLLRSETMTFPDEALAEIRQERMLTPEEESELPPCRVEIVLGAEGRLFVVLPTGVETDLPFACNAPFIQDPARLKVKDPGLSATNRWLLERAGELAGSAIVEWLARRELSTEDRSRAYGLLPPLAGDDGSLESSCCGIVRAGLKSAIEGKPILLTDDGAVLPAEGAVVLPPILFEIWPTETLAPRFDVNHRPSLSRHVSTAECRRLCGWRLTEEVGRSRVVETLKVDSLPRPGTWSRLAQLWAYIWPEVDPYSSRPVTGEFRIVPVEGDSVLHAARDVVRVGKEKAFLSDENWHFLSRYLTVLDADWVRYLASPGDTTGEAGQAAVQRRSGTALHLLRALGLENATDVNRVAAQVTASFFGSGKEPVSDCIRLTQILAKFGARAPQTFFYCTEDGTLRKVSDGVVWDRYGTLAPLLPDSWRASHSLHHSYTDEFQACSRSEWTDWVASSGSGLRLMPQIEERRSFTYSAKKFEARLHEMGYHGIKPSYPHAWAQTYKSQRYTIVDFDFDSSLYESPPAPSDRERLMREITRLLLETGSWHWFGREIIRAEQTTTNGGSVGKVDIESMPAQWVRKLSELPVLRDTRGAYRKPKDLLRRTPATEPLLEVEPFVEARIDVEAVRPLLDLLGVRSAPTGPARLVASLRALAESANPPVEEVDKWYRRLDRIVETCSTEDLEHIRQAFRSERLILTQDGAWALAGATFLSTGDGEAPDAAIVRSTVSGLRLWRVIGVADQPTADLAVAWLRTLPSGQALSQDDARRVRALLRKYPLRIWTECAHWLNVGGVWVPTGQLMYALTMQSLFRWKHLAPWVKEKTADLQGISAEVTRESPFLQLKVLAQQVEERLAQSPAHPLPAEQKEWLTTLGRELFRMKFETAEVTQRVRAQASRLAETEWQLAPELTIVPYIGGAPAGAPQRADVVWLDRTLYVDQLSKARLARRVPEEVGNAFNSDDIRLAAAYSFERSSVEVRRYIEENFEIDEEAEGSSGPDLEQRALASENDGVAGSTDNSGRPIGDVESRPEESDRAALPGDAGASRHPRRPSLPSGPSIMARFAALCGFQRNGDGHFFHPDGGRIGPADGSRSLWECRSITGDLVRYYLPRDLCLEREPLELKVDAWLLFDQHPEIYSLILSSVDGKPLEVTGHHLRAMLDADEVALIPASYRLVAKDDHGR